MNVNLLRSSFDALRPHAPLLVDRFYATLFERYPQVRPLFVHTDLPKQKQMLIQALSLLVANLEQPDVLKTYLGHLGAKHVRYGAREAHYAAVGECLLAAMAEVAGPLWTEELEHEWAETYGAVASLMQQGAATTVVI
ncbi:MAG TPA: globin domain-containing protein [Planctomycetota bacterium]|jgi:hemoglobin-like flavoprotein|nr:globin domain-containing protein [Planctomycetota bacterium]